jgi:hypothetical protein
MMRLITLISTLYASGVCACTIPVFRYALDRWEADKFHLVLPASVAQDTVIQDLLRPLRANGKANLDITISRDSLATTAELRSSRDSGQIIWSGALEKNSLEALLDSPARRKLVERALAGDSVVWVIADSGSPQDTVEIERIEQRLKFLEQVAALPIQDPNDPDSQLGPGPPLRLKFATLRLRRDDPAETALLRMLAGPKGKVDPGSTSFVAAVFGRGRVLGAWPLTLLDDASLEEACMFLVGRCGCRMKNENPGWDILLNVDWEKALQSVVSTSEPSANTASSAPKVASVPEVVRISATDDSKTAEPKAGAILLVALGAVLIGLFCFRAWKAAV